jgi:hypothetical protein
MSWDLELERLSKTVHDVLGEEAFGASVLRAFEIAMRTPVGLVADTDDIPLDSVLVQPDGSVFSMDAYYEVLRIELRRHVQ